MVWIDGIILMVYIGLILWNFIFQRSASIFAAQIRNGHRCVNCLRKREYVGFGDLEEFWKHNGQMYCEDCYIKTKRYDKLVHMVGSKKQRVRNILSLLRRYSFKVDLIKRPWLISMGVCFLISFVFVCLGWTNNFTIFNIFMIFYWAVVVFCGEYIKRKVRVNELRP